VDVVESHAHGMVVDLTCNASDGDHAEAVDRVDAVKLGKVSDRNLSFVASAAP
jgi:hypothetical protein